MERRTHQKECVYDTLRQMGHATAAQLYEQARHGQPRLGIATVYRLLSKGVAEGSVRRISFEGEDDRYDLTLTPHAHVCCRRCGRVEDLPLPDLSPTEQAAKRLGYTVEQGTVSLCGLCADCKGR